MTYDILMDYQDILKYLRNQSFVFEAEEGFYNKGKLAKDGYEIIVTIKPLICSGEMLVVDPSATTDEFSGVTIAHFTWIGLPEIETALDIAFDEIAQRVTAPTIQ